MHVLVNRERLRLASYLRGMQPSQSHSKKSKIRRNLGSSNLTRQNRRSCRTRVTEQCWRTKGHSDRSYGEDRDVENEINRSRVRKGHAAVPHQQHKTYR